MAEAEAEAGVVDSEAGGVGRVAAGVAGSFTSAPCEEGGHDFGSGSGSGSCSGSAAGAVHTNRQSLNSFERFKLRLLPCSLGPNKSSRIRFCSSDKLSTKSSFDAIMSRSRLFNDWRWMVASHWL